MMPSQKNNQFSASDIERYHAGTMPAAEMHALEKAALDDPFLADALEGYAVSAHPEAELATLRARLEEKKKEKRGVVFFMPRRLATAAVILLLAGGAWLAFEKLSPDNKQDIALKQAPPSSTQRQSPDSSSSNYLMPNQSLADSAADEVTASNATQRKKAAQRSVAPAPGSIRADAPSSFNKDLSQVAAAENKEAQNQVADSQMQRADGFINTAPLNKTASASSPAANNNFSARRDEVAYRKNALKRLDSSYPPSSNEAVRYGNSTLKKDSVARGLAVSNQGLYRKTNDTIRNLHVVMKPLDAPALQEVVLEKGAKKRMQGRVAGLVIDSLEPAEGWTKFDDYVASNLKMPEELRDKPTSGEVQLAFDVNEQGEPVNIHVVKSLCAKCDEEAIRLLKQGPKWKKKKKKSGKVTIKF